jgi:hypothetical protein
MKKIGGEGREEEGGRQKKFRRQKAGGKTNLFRNFPPFLVPSPRARANFS